MIDTIVPMALRSARRKAPGRKIVPTASADAVSGDYGPVWWIAVGVRAVQW